MTGIPSWAVRGAKVVCINAGRDAFKYLRPNITNWSDDLDGLADGEVYTIREVVRHPTGIVGLSLVEIVRKIYGQDRGQEVPFALGRFRPLIIRSQIQDVAQFIHHLDNAGVDA